MAEMDGTVLQNHISPDFKEFTTAGSAIDLEDNSTTGFPENTDGEGSQSGRLVMIVSAPASSTLNVDTADTAGRTLTAEHYVGKDLPCYIKKINASTTSGIILAVFR